MISHDKKFIIICPPKTASTSVVVSLLKYASINKVIRENYKNFEFTDEFAVASKHTPISAMMDKSPFKNYLKIGMVRNPFDRIVSRWKWHRAKNTFSDFITYSKRNPMPMKFDPLSNQLNYFTFNNEIKIDRFIRYESLQSDFNQVCEEIGIAPIKLDHLNKTRRKDYTVYYNEKLKDMLSEIFHPDIDFFNYKFGE
jgi:hypothetical protein